MNRPQTCLCPLSRATVIAKLLVTFNALIVSLPPTYNIEHTRVLRQSDRFNHSGAEMMKRALFSNQLIYERIEFKRQFLNLVAGRLGFHFRRYNEHMKRECPCFLQRESLVLGTYVFQEFQKAMFNCRTLAPGLLIQPKAVQKLTWLNDSREGTRLRRSDGVAEQMPSRKNRAKARQHLLSNRHLGVEEYIAKLSLFRVHFCAF